MNSIISEPLFKFGIHFAEMPSFFLYFTSGFVGNYSLLTHHIYWQFPVSIEITRNFHATLRYILFQPKLSVGEKAGFEPAPFVDLPIILVSPPALTNWAIPLIKIKNITALLINILSEIVYFSSVLSFYSFLSYILAL